MTIKVTEEMRQAGLRELQGELTDDELAVLLHRDEVENCFDAVEIPGQVRPTWEEISAGLEQLLAPDAASVIERELTSGRCYLCVEKFSSGTRAVLASVKDASTVAGPYLPSDYEFLQDSTDYKWTQYDDTTWFVVSSKEDIQHES